MQRGMVDTVTDIIAGNTGALTYCIILAVLICSGRLAERENMECGQKFFKEKERGALDEF